MFDQQVPAMDVGLNDEKFSYVTSPAAFRTLVHAAITVLPQRENILAALQLQIVQSCVLSEVIGIAWAVHHVGACVAHTEQVWSTGFHSGSNAYYITPHSQT